MKPNETARVFGSWYEPVTLFFGVWLLVFAIGFPFASLDPFPHHEGSILYPAYAANHGIMPLKDVAVQHLPTTPFMYSLAFKCFGETLLVSRYVTLVVIACLAGCLSLIGRCFIPSKLAGGFTVVYAVSSWLIWDLITRPWPSLWALCFVTASSLTLCHYASRGGNRLLLLAGTLTGGAFVFRINLGGYALVAFTLVLIGLAWQKGQFWNRRAFWALLKELTTLWMACAAVILLSALSYAYILGIAPLVKLFAFQKHMLPILQSLTGRYHALSDLGVSRIGLSTGGLYVLTYVVGCGVLFRRRLAWPEATALAVAVLICGERLRFLSLDLGIPVIIVALWDWWRNNLGLSAPERSRYLVLIGTAAAAWGLMFPGHDPRYLAWSGGLIFLLIAVRLYWLWRSPCEAGQPNKIILGVVSVALFLLTINVPQAKRLAQVLRSPRVLIATGGFYKSMRGDPAAGRGYADYAALREYVQRHSSPKDTVLILSDESLHAADWERSPASLPHINLDNLLYRLPNGPEIERNMIAKFRKSPPALVLKRNESWELPSVLLDSAFPELNAYIETSYQTAWESPSRFYTVLVPRANRERN